MFLICIMIKTERLGLKRNNYDGRRLYFASMPDESSNFTTVTMLTYQCTHIRHVDVLTVFYLRPALHIILGFL